MKRINMYKTTRLQGQRISFSIPIIGKIISYIFFQKISASMKKAFVRQLDHPDYHLLPQMK